MFLPFGAVCVIIKAGAYDLRIPRRRMNMTDEKNQRINECLTEIRTKQSVSHVELLYDLMGNTIRHIALKYLRDADAADELV